MSGNHNSTDIQQGGREGGREGGIEGRRGRCGRGGGGSHKMFVKERDTEEKEREREG